MGPEVLPARAGNAPSRKLGGLLLLLSAAAGLGVAAPRPGAGRADDEKKTGPAPRVARVSPDDAAGAVEVSVAINPTNPDHMVAASIARVRDQPGITDFAYVTTDAGRTWKMVPRANPHKVQQGDDVVTFTPDGVAGPGSTSTAAPGPSTRPTSTSPARPTAASRSPSPTRSPRRPATPATKAIP
jgi:hypothetical protein